MLSILEQFGSLFWQHTCEPNSHVQVQDMMTRYCRLLQMFIHWIETSETENMFQGAFDIETLDSRWALFESFESDFDSIDSWCFLMFPVQPWSSCAKKLWKRTTWRQRGGRLELPHCTCNFSMHLFQFNLAGMQEILAFVCKRWVPLPWLRQPWWPWFGREFPTGHRCCHPNSTWIVTTNERARKQKIRAWRWLWGCSAMTRTAWQGDWGRC